MRLVLRCCVALLGLSACAFAQTATGTIQGRVADASGALIAEASVAAENKNTGVRQTTVSNSQGSFIMPYLIPGEYRIVVEKTGFDKQVVSDIKLSVQQTIALEIALKIGSINQTVEVNASVAQLSTSTSAVSTVITNKAMLDLPLNGRNPSGWPASFPASSPAAVPRRGFQAAGTHRAKLRLTVRRSLFPKTTSASRTPATRPSWTQWKKSP